MTLALGATVRADHDADLHIHLHLAHHARVPDQDGEYISQGTRTLEQGTLAVLSNNICGNKFTCTLA